MKAVITEAENRGEPVTMMEPLLVRQTGKRRARLADLALELAARFSSGTGTALDAGTVSGAEHVIRAVRAGFSRKEKVRGSSWFCAGIEALLV